MEVYLEIIKHPAPGRLGRLHLGRDDVPTPNLFHFPNYPGKNDLYLTGSESKTNKKPIIYDYDFFSIEDNSKIKPVNFALLPEFSAGFNIPKRLAEAAMKESFQLAEKHPGQGAVISPTKYPDLVERAATELRHHPLLAIAGGEKLASNPRLLVEVITKIREISSPNTALYYPFSPPSMFPVLAYMGVDLFDTAQAILAAVRGMYLTWRGFKTLGRMKELPCSCWACRDKTPQDIASHRDALVKHNLAVTKSLISEIREALREERLREYVERTASTDPGVMAILRILSREKGYFLEHYTPVSSSTPQVYVSQESYLRPEVKRWHQRLKSRYLPQAGFKLSIILPCSARKPYSKSRSHRLIRRYIRKGARDKLNLVHEVTLTSPLGLVPRELEEVFPAGSYDIPVTGHWSEEEKSVILELLTDYMNRAGTHVIAQVDGIYREICAEAGTELGMEEYLSKASLEHLSRRIAAILEDYEPGEGAYIEGKGVCDYQFGPGASEYLLPPGSERRGRAFYYRGWQIAAVNPSTGLLALTLKGGQMLYSYGRYQVKASLKPPSSNFFCVGVEEADNEIRPGDEVILVYDGEVVGVGRAVISGGEMQEAEHGLAVKLRHRK
jgi:archaeosine synthase